MKSVSYIKKNGDEQLSPPFRTQEYFYELRIIRSNTAFVLLIKNSPPVAAGDERLIYNEKMITGIDLLRQRSFQSFQTAL